MRRVTVVALCVCLCVCVCLCGQNNFPRLLVAASDSACLPKLKHFDVWILLKTYGSKVIARNTFQDAFVKTERTGRETWSIPTLIGLT